MKAFPVLLNMLFAAILLSCKKQTVASQVIPIPNGDFELWDSMPLLYNWQTNSCRACVPPWETYIIKKVTDKANGQFAAQFIYNNAYSSLAENKFPIPAHPTSLVGDIKSNIAPGDTATIYVDLFSNGNIVAGGDFYETTSSPNYRRIEIPITQTTAQVDSALVKIAGGKKQNTQLFVDNLVFVKITKYRQQI